MLRKADTVARTGGDEFAVILQGVCALAEAEQIATAVKGALDRPTLLVGQPYHISASIGAAIYRDDGVSQTDLHAVADDRMYADKERDRADPSYRRGGPRLVGGTA